MASTKVQRIMTQPIKARIQIWLFEQKDLRIEGRIIGFDEYMNLVLDDAEEVNVKKKSRKSLGTASLVILLPPPFYIFSSVSFSLACPELHVLYFSREDSSERRQHHADDEHGKVSFHFGPS
ncbi:Small nuclear ribonucleoprotein E [Linum grandiflorum]